MRKIEENKKEMYGNLEEERMKWCRERTVDMIGQIENGKFLIQVFTIVKKHIEKRGN